MSGTAVEQVRARGDRPAWLWFLIACGGVAAFFFLAVLATVIVGMGSPRQEMPESQILVLARMSKDAGRDRAAALARLDSIVPIVARAYGETQDTVASRAIACSANLQRAGVIQDPVQVLEGLSVVAPVKIAPGNLRTALDVYAGARIRGYRHDDAITAIGVAMLAREPDPPR